MSLSRTAKLLGMEVGKSTDGDVRLVISPDFFRDEANLPFLLPLLR